MYQLQGIIKPHGMRENLVWIENSGLIVVHVECRSFKKSHQGNSAFWMFFSQFQALYSGKLRKEPRTAVCRQSNHQVRRLEPPEASLCAAELLGMTSCSFPEFISHHKKAELHSFHIFGYRL